MCVSDSLAAARVSFAVATPKAYRRGGALPGISSAMKICRASVSDAETKAAFHRMSHGDASDVDGQRTRRENGSERVKRPGTNAIRNALLAESVSTSSMQAAEKAIKALFQHLHKEAWGHVLIALLGALPQKNRPDAELMDRARVLDRHYIPTRYPNGFERGAPVDFYSQKDADEAIAHAEAILGFCRNQIS